MAISQYGRFSSQNRIIQIFKFIEPAEEVSNLSTRYLESENQTDIGNCYWIIATSNKQTSNTLCHLFQLQQVEIVLQNVFHSQKGEITTWLREHMRMLISDFGAFLHFKKQLAIT